MQRPDAKELLERSLSARRAWIEMTKANVTSALGYSRSPQGERG